MSYLLYKKAEIDQAAINQIGGAVGGGALGYLMTRYGLGIKGVGAGLTGAGVGATLGSISGSYLSDYGKGQDKQKRMNTVQKLKIKNRVDEPVHATARRRLKDPVSMVAGAGAAGYATTNANDAIEADLKSSSKKLDTAVRGATKDKALKKKLLNQNPDPDVISGALKKLKGKNTSKERKLYNKLSAKALDKGTTSVKRKAISRTKRGGKAGILMYLLTAGGMTAFDRFDQNPRREKLLNEEGTK
jgi:hypothetical protein